MEQFSNFLVESLAALIPVVDPIGTEKIGAIARSVANPGTEIIACNPDMGTVSIEGHYDEALSVVGILDEIRKGEAESIDGYIIACFGDPGLLAARELATAPVIGIAEATMHAASFIATGFSIVTTLNWRFSLSHR